MIIEEIFKNRGTICNEVLRALPDYFEVESYIQDYVRNIESLPTFTAREDGVILGFLSLKIHNKYTAEIYVMGVKNEFQNKGIGKALLERAEKYLSERKYKFLTVKTLSPAIIDEGYAKTRNFYSNKGFLPLEEFKQIWDENNPCLLLVKVL